MYFVLCLHIQYWGWAVSDVDKKQNQKTTYCIGRRTTKLFNIFAKNV
jgi:hypothetical protein